MTDSHYPAAEKTIMVVDDEPDLVEIVRLMLARKRFNVMCAYGGQQVFAGLEKQKPDLILLDISMSEIDGFEVLRRLKGAPETSSIPIIMLTALESEEYKLKSYKLGADYFITKPFDYAELMTGINRFLSEDHLEEVSQ